MFLRTLALAFMFLVRLRFPSRLSLLQVIRNRYGDTIIKLVNKFEKVDFKHRKAALDLNVFNLAGALMLSRNFCNSVSLIKISEDQKLTKSV